MIRTDILLYFVFLLSFQANAQADGQDHPIVERPDRYTVDINKYKGEKVYYSHMFDPIPQFPGGYKEFNNYINSNVVIDDKSAKEINLIVTYIVEPDGSISNIEFLQEPKTDVRNQIIKAMQSAPKFIPGKFDAKPGRALFERTPLTIYVP
jgi:hypothetical protein